MNNEEKAKAYDEALKAAQCWLNAPQAIEDFGYTVEDAIQNIFPDLRESEDDRTRKWIANYIHRGVFNEEEHPMALKAIEYLEKQKECVADSSKTSVDEDEKIRKEIIEVLSFVPSSMWEQAKTNYERCLAYLEKQKEQKPAEWSEDYREEDIQTRFAFYSYKDDPSNLYLSNVFVEESSRNHGFGTKILKAAEKVAETVGATTISLKVKQDSPANAWYRKNGYGYVAFEDGYDWLEKNLEYMKPNKQEWSEEDERILKGIIGKIDHDQTYGVSKVEMLSFLKSLRPVSKESLQPHWKPSEEQMRALLGAEGISRASGYPDNAKVLASLYEQLKKL